MIERRPFGRTGHQSSATIFGAAALARASQDEADRALEVLLGHGVNHIDTAARYGDSELRIGPWMARHRKDFFLATKTGSRGARAAREDLHRSLERLRVDSVDLIQIHSLGHPDDWDQVMGPDGALEPLVEARAQGLARAIGVTGHGWSIAAMHRRSLARFDFDSILLPYNFFMVQNDRYREAFGEVTAICQERNVAVQTIKGIARGPWATADRSHTPPGTSPSNGRKKSIWPSTGRWAGPASSSIPRGTWPCCRACSTRPPASPAVPRTRR
jgi:aryl-alcohol dehydrogenase-like predicted oxidoreductase